MWNVRDRNRHRAACREILLLLHLCFSNDSQSTRYALCMLVQYCIILVPVPVAYNCWHLLTHFYCILPVVYITLFISMHTGSQDAHLRISSRHCPGLQEQRLWFLYLYTYYMTYICIQIRSRFTHRGFWKQTCHTRAILSWELKIQKTNSLWTYDFEDWLRYQCPVSIRYETLCMQQSAKHRWTFSL